jgi:hypothetical protein
MRVSLRGAGLLMLVAGLLLFALFSFYFLPSPSSYVLGTLPAYIMMGVGLVLIVFGKLKLSLKLSRTLGSILSLCGIMVLMIFVYNYLPQFTMWAVIGSSALLALYHPWWQPKRNKRITMDEAIRSDRLDVAQPSKSKSWREWLSQPVGAKKEITHTSQPEEPPKREAMSGALPKTRRVKPGTIGLFMVLLVVIWAVSPVFVADPTPALVLTNTGVKGNFTLRLQNLTPWPITFRGWWIFANPIQWMGTNGPAEVFTLPPFGAYVFQYYAIGGSETNSFVTFSGRVTLLYRSYPVWINSW